MSNTIKQGTKVKVTQTGRFFGIVGSIQTDYGPCAVVEVKLNGDRFDLFLNQGDYEVTDGQAADAGDGADRRHPA